MKRLLWLAGIVVVIIVGVVSYRWWQDPSVAQTPVGGIQAPDDDVLGASSSMEPWNTSLFATKMPNFLRVETSNEDSHASIMGSYLLTKAAGDTNDQIGVTVGRLGNSSLSEVSGVKLRLNAPQTYSQTSRVYAPAGALVFSRTPGYETAIFWQHGNDYVAVVASGTADRQADLEQALNSIITNWQWR